MVRAKAANVKRRMRAHLTWDVKRISIPNTLEDLEWSDELRQQLAAAST